MKGVKNGFGEYYTKAGDVLKCNWKDGKPHGQGFLKRRNGVETMAEWKNGQLFIGKSN